MPAYRAVPADRRDEYRSILQHAFAIESGPDRDESEGEWPPPLSEPRGLFDGDDLVSVCKCYYPDVFLHGEYTTIGGLGGVATPPEHRRQGYTRTLIRHALREYREDGVTLVALWPFSTPFYRNLGWGTAGRYTRYEIPPDQLAFARGFAGEVRRLTPDDWERLRAVEVAFGEGVALSMRRSEAWWRRRTLADWPGDDRPYIYGYERDGDLRGYVLYTVSTSDGERRLRVADMAVVDEAARHALLGFLSNHDSQVDAIELRRAEETTLLAEVPDPHAVECAIESGAMIRLTDVVTALETYPWGGVDLDLTFGVSDPLLESNDGAVRVSVTDGTATVNEGRADDADVTVDVATLSKLFVGTCGVEAAERFGGLAIAEPSVREPLAEAFTPTQVSLREFF